MCLALICFSVFVFRRVHQRCGQPYHSVDSPSWVPLPSVAKERHQAVAAALWSHVFPFLCSMRLSQTPPPQLADAAAGQGNRENELLFSQGLSLHGCLFSVGSALKELNRRELYECAVVLMHTSRTTHQCVFFIDFDKYYDLLSLSCSVSVALLKVEMWEQMCKI